MIQIRGKTQIKNGTVVRDNLNIDSSGDAVIRKIIAGTGITLLFTGADSGTGDVTINASGVAGSGGASAFTDLTDAPSDYTGYAKSLISVTNSEDGVEFNGIEYDKLVIFNALGRLATDLPPASDNAWLFGDPSYAWRHIYTYDTTFTEVPVTPVSLPNIGHLALYAKTDEKLYTVTTSGIEKQLMYYDDFVASGLFLTVQESDLSPTVSGVLTMVFPPNSVTDSGNGEVQIAFPEPNQAHVLMISGNLTVGAGTLSTAFNTSQIMSHYGSYVTGAADGDELTFKLPLKSGTYRFYVIGLKSSSRGKLDWYLDGATFITGQDWYNSTNAFNTEFTATGITVADSGTHTIKCKVNGKNASSSGYAVSWTFFIMSRTGD